MSRFTDYFEWLMTWEGEVYEDDPDDAGGATKFGIDQASHPEVNIRNLTRDQAKGIYRDDYWNQVRADELPVPLDWVVCDIAVNNGGNRAIRWLQDAVGVEADGKFGPLTLKAVQGCDAVKVTRELLDRRERFYRSIAKGSQRKFLNGWLNRNNSLRQKTLGQVG